MEGERGLEGHDANVEFTPEGHRELLKGTGRYGGPSVCSSGGKDLGQGVVLPCRGAESGEARPVPETQVDHHNAALFLCLISQCTPHCPPIPQLGLALNPREEKECEKAIIVEPCPYDADKLADKGRGSKEAPERAIVQVKGWELRQAVCMGQGRRAGVEWMGQSSESSRRPGVCVHAQNAELDWWRAVSLWRFEKKAQIKEFLHRS